ncbi:MAG TPA: exodeoxyribonuclease VII small subunit [Candidatus Saccharimonadales bacterium]|nr:exodeoxyribonuclease VII small subunit [Candidatus Saccharimonadales bacterium]
MASSKVNLTEALKKLNQIVQWFEAQEDVDVEAGLDRVKEAAKLIKSSRSRLAEIENEFKEIEKDIAETGKAVPGEEEQITVTKRKKTVVEATDESVNLDDIPF